MAEIVLTNVTKRWGKFYGVDNLNLVIGDNAFVTLLGPSGCGKTTTLRMIAGLETPTTGRITIDGVPMFDSERGINVPANKRRVGFLFQNYALWPNMTVYQNIAFGLSNINESGASVNEKGEVVRDETGKAPARKLTKEEIKRVVDRVSAIVKIGPFMERYPSELSGGQQQRVAIARTLAPGPRVLFMDEPLSNLDAKLRLEMRSELQRLHIETGSTFIYVTHDQLEAMTLSTKVCLMENGVLQQYDRPLTLYNSPSNLFAADFVGNPAINFISTVGNQQADGSLSLTVWEGRKAHFVPNEPLDLAEALEKAAKEKPEVNKEKSNQDKLFNYPVATFDGREREAPVPSAGELPLVLGVRPEFVQMDEQNGIKGEVFSAMPTGMETTLKIRVGDYLVTGVIFGGITFKIGQTIFFGFREKQAMLFDKLSGRLLAHGTLTVDEA